jgi:hypothetical protein
MTLSAGSDSLAEVVSTFRQWLYLPDPGPVEVYLAAIAANRMKGDPVWLQFVGGPSTGKTEIILSGSALPDVYLASVLTEAGLLSGTPIRDRPEHAGGGLLMQVGSFGIILCKDFSSVLAMHRDSRAKVLAALREIYDGRWTRNLGSDGGQTLSWSGKIGLVAGCTPSIDGHHAVVSAMGERFVFYRMPPVDGQQQAIQALHHAGKEVLMRAELARAVKGFMTGLKLASERPTLGDDQTEALVALARLAARSRSSVERDGYRREIELIPEPEAPGRLARILSQLFAGMAVAGIGRQEAWRLVKKIALDSMPAIRRAVLEVLLSRGETRTGTAAVAAKIGYPDQTTRRALEDLNAHGVVDGFGGGQGKQKSWQLSQWAWEQYAMMEITLPEMSGET